LFLQWYNTSCYQSTPTLNAGIANVVGNGARGAITGPPTKRFDFSLFKNIPIGSYEGSKSLQLRMEVFNVFNHTNFRALASTNVTSTLVGQISTVRDPRTIQIGAKLTF
jgi:hypothetical protein